MLYLECSHTFQYKVILRNFTNRARDNKNVGKNNNKSTTCIVNKILSYYPQIWVGFYHPHHTLNSFNKKIARAPDLEKGNYCLLAVSAEPGLVLPLDDPEPNVRIWEPPKCPPYFWTHTDFIKESCIFFQKINSNWSITEYNTYEVQSNKHISTVFTRSAPFRIQISIGILDKQKLSFCF